MRRHIISPRANWRQRAEEFGYDFYAAQEGEIWSESCYYQFTLRQIEKDLEQATNELHALCLDAVGRIVNDEQALRRLAIPQFAWDMVKNSWNSRDPSLYGRMDFSYDGKSPAKLLEYNADTPTSVFESAVFQWQWMEEMRDCEKLPARVDQFNSLHDLLVTRFAKLPFMGRTFHFSTFEDYPEDRGTVRYLQDCATQAGFETIFVDLEKIGYSSFYNSFVDHREERIDCIFKLYPWEWMLKDTFGEVVAKTDTTFVEPPWKMVLSNKAVLPYLWKYNKGHPNLLPAFFADEDRTELGTSYVKKPIFSREGANVLMVKDRKVIGTEEGPYGTEGFVFQALAELPVFTGYHALIGSWVVDNVSCGIIMRESTNPVTDNFARIVPHIILD